MKSKLYGRFIPLIILSILLGTAVFAACDKKPKNGGQEKAQYSVSFYSDGRQYGETVKVEDGGKVTRPVDPTKEDFVFGGWFKEENCVNLWIFDTDTVEANTILYAYWVVSQGVSYILNSDGESYQAKGTPSGTIGDIYISATYNNKPVTNIAAEGFADCANITSVTISNGVTAIGGDAFNDCSKLERISIPDSVNSIGYRAFWGTDWYKNQPNGLIYAGKVAYAYKGTIPNDILQTFKPDTVGIGDRSFAFSNLKEVVIPDSVTNIGKSAFSGCERMTGLTIGRNVKSIGEDAFLRCGRLNSIIIPDSVTSIGSEAFSECSGATSIILGSGVTDIGNSVFSYCSSLTKIIIPDSFTRVGNGMFSNCESLTNVTIGSGVTHIDIKAFYCCTALTTITIPNGVTRIDDEAFYDCQNLGNINIADSVISIGKRAFDRTLWYNNHNNSTVVYAGRVAYDYKGQMPANTTIKFVSNTLAIADSAFSGLSGLTQITIPQSVIKIGSKAFYRCINLGAINFEGTIDQWNEITKEEGWKYDISAVAVKCGENDWTPL